MEGEEREWYARTPDDDEFERRKLILYRDGLGVNISSWQSKNYFGLKVTPLPGEQMVTDLPPYVGSPWHITLGTTGEHSQEYNTRIRTLMQRYGRPRQARLRFSKITWNGIAYLEHDDPVATDPYVQAVHRRDPYQRRIPLHVTM